MTQSTVLVVEDDDDTREYFVFLLADAGYHVVDAASGKAALLHIAAQPIDVVMVDRRGSDMDGLDICRQIRAQLGMAMPIIIVTADYEPYLEATARTAGATAFLRKPVLPDVLLKQLRALVPA